MCIYSLTWLKSYNKSDLPQKERLLFTFLTVQLRPVPVHVIFFVENFQDLVFSERELVVGGGVEVVLRDRLHARPKNNLFCKHFETLFDRSVRLTSSLLAEVGVGISCPYAVAEK